MSITSDLRTYADNALSSAQQQLNDVTGIATEYVGKAGDVVDPYVAQVKGYVTPLVTPVIAPVEQVYTGLRNDKRVSKVVDTATAWSEAVLEQVNERVVVPVRSFTGLGGKPTTAKPSPRPAAKKPAAARSTRRPAAKKPAARKTSTASTASTTAKSTPSATA